MMPQLVHEWQYINNVIIDTIQHVEYIQSGCCRLRANNQSATRCSKRRLRWLSWTASNRIRASVQMTWSGRPLMLKARSAVWCFTHFVVYDHGRRNMQHLCGSGWGTTTMLVVSNMSWLDAISASSLGVNIKAVTSCWQRWICASWLCFLAFGLPP